MAQVKGYDVSHQSQAIFDDMDSEGMCDDNSAGNRSEEEDEQKLKKLEDELERLAHDPELLIDLMKLKRTTEDKEVDV